MIDPLPQVASNSRFRMFPAVMISEVMGTTGVGVGEGGIAGVGVAEGAGVWVAVTVANGIEEGVSASGLSDEDGGAPVGAEHPDMKNAVRASRDILIAAFIRIPSLKNELLSIINCCQQAADDKKKYTSEKKRSSLKPLIGCKFSIPEESAILYPHPVHDCRP